MAALHFLLPTGHSRSGRRSFDSKLISLLPLDEVPVHVHPFAARAPCDSKGSECQCGIHTAEAASALRSRKTERAAKEKPTPISQFFLAPAAPSGRDEAERGVAPQTQTDFAAWSGALRNCCSKDIDELISKNTSSRKGAKAL